MNENKLQNSTIKPIKRLSWFSLILSILTFGCIFFLITTVNVEFNRLQEPVPHIFTNLWRGYMDIITLLLLLTLILNLVFVKRSTKVVAQICIIVGMISLIALSNIVTLGYKIDRVPNTSKLTTDRVNNIYVDYQTKYSIQQIQLATVILALPSLYAIIMIILTNYYWQKPVKA